MIETKLRPRSSDTFFNDTTVYRMHMRRTYN